MARRHRRMASIIRRLNACPLGKGHVCAGVDPTFPEATCMVVTEDQKQPAVCHERKARRSDGNLDRRTSSGLRNYVPYNQAGHMTRATKSFEALEKCLPWRAVHYDRRHESADVVSGGVALAVARDTHPQRPNFLGVRVRRLSGAHAISTGQVRQHGQCLRLVGGTKLGDVGNRAGNVR